MKKSHRELANVASRVLLLCVSCMPWACARTGEAVSPKTSPPPEHSGSAATASSSETIYQRKFPPSRLTKDKPLLDVIRWSATRKGAEKQLRAAGFSIQPTDDGFKAEVRHQAGTDLLGTSETIELSYRGDRLVSVKRQWRPDLSPQRIASVGQSFHRLAKEYASRLGNADKGEVGALSYRDGKLSSGRASWGARSERRPAVSLEIFAAGAILMLSEEVRYEQEQDNRVGSASADLGDPMGQTAAWADSN